jgi:hypothetical protein
VRRLQRAPKASLAVAGILATPLFFVALLALSLKLDEPSVHMARNGAEVLGDPTKGTIGTIYLFAFGISLGIVLVGALSMLTASRLGVIVPALAAIVVTALLLLPLSTWEKEHTRRYPLGVDFIPKRDAEDLILRGEWEDNAHRAARQIGGWTIALAVAAIALTFVFEVRRRRGHVSAPVPPPPDVATGAPQTPG